MRATTRHQQYNPARRIISYGDKPTAREYEAWGFIAKGHPNKVIALDMKCSEATVKVYIASLFVKLGVTNRVQLALLWHGIKPVGETARQYTDRDLRELVARDCYFRYREMMGMNTEWDDMPAAFRENWRASVTMGVVVNGNLFEPKG